MLKLHVGIWCKSVAMLTVPTVWLLFGDSILTCACWACFHHCKQTLDDPTWLFLAQVEISIFVLGICVNRSLDAWFSTINSCEVIIFYVYQDSAPRQQKNSFFLLLFIRRIALTRFFFRCSFYQGAVLYICLFLAMGNNNFNLWLWILLPK